MYRPCLGLAIYKLYQVLTNTLLLQYFIITKIFGLNESVGIGLYILCQWTSLN